ncbi:hypothetical protein D3C71_1703000 [compost metagenome]
MSIAELELQILALVDRIIRLAAGADKELAFFQHVGFISVSSMKAGGSQCRRGAPSSKCAWISVIGGAVAPGNKAVPIRDRNAAISIGR